MSSAQAAVEAGNAAAAQNSMKVSSVTSRLGSILSGKSRVVERMHERTRQKSGELFGAIAAGPESLLEAQAFGDRGSTRVVSGGPPTASAVVRPPASKASRCLRDGPAATRCPPMEIQQKSMNSIENS